MKYSFILIKSFIAATILIAISSVAKAQIPACSTYVFNTSNETYAYLTGGTSVNLQSDDITQPNIPIGFTFMFCGVNYTQVSACSNGWLSFSNSTSTAYTNSSATSMSGIVPMLMPCFDDLYGAGGGFSSYLTTGVAPNRVFTFEWRNWRPLSYTSNSEISFQVRLYESSNTIKFHYKKEGSNPLPSATMGIGYSTTDYQTLPNTSTSPVPSSTTFTINLTSYPAVGQIYQWDPPTPCAKSTALTLGAYNSTSASFSWTGVSGAGSYDYAVDANAALSPAVATTIYNTTTTSGSVIGLTPSTNYFLHVRTRCSPVSISQWDTISFRTLPPCSKPSGVVFSNIDSNSAAFQWANASNVLQFQYVVDRVRTNPTSTNPYLQTTTTTFVQLPDTCVDGTLYYVHIRAKCVANDSSAWSLDSFRTPVPCRRPSLAITYLSAGNSITSWPAVPTAYNYEYYLGPLTSLPAAGTPIILTSVQTPYLVPKTNYTMSVRCNCEFYGVKSTSEWSSIDFTTPSAQGVETVSRTIGIEAHPNPVKDILSVRVIGGMQNATLSISDLNGKLISRKTSEGEMTHMDVSSLVPGVYVVKYTDEYYSKTIKFIKE